MKLGAIFPQTEIGLDPLDIREYTLAVERLDFDYILAFDHVLGADVSNRPNWVGPYTQQHSFLEPFVLFAYMAAITSTIELATGIIILPQRQTALVAKQAATLDVLSNGRLRLGIGIGWNSVEYEALGEDFSNRGIRSEEQVDVMRALWTNQTISYDGH
ncbi:MAG: TIGR03619 family F420-dependent LLM class oxidoreductase, partial [Anaerolineales bacterium]